MKDRKQHRYEYCEDCNCVTSIPMMEETKVGLYEKVICNCCGQLIVESNQLPKKEYVHIKKTWGYFSNKDGQVDTINICETCYDKWVATFVKKVNTKEATELV